MLETVSQRWLILVANISKRLREMGVRSIDDFAQGLAGASAWRRTELSKLVSAFDLQYRAIREAHSRESVGNVVRYEYLNAIEDESDESDESTFRASAMSKRALYVLAYSHWEGYVKQAVRLYLNSLAFISISEVSNHPRMVRSFTLRRIENHKIEANKMLEFSDEGMRKLREGFLFYGEDDYRISFSVNEINKLITSGTNLNFKTLEDLFENLDVDLPPYFSGVNIQILNCMVKIRNGIAHGDPDYRDGELPGELTDGLPRTIEFVSDAFAEVQDALIAKADSTFR